MNETPQTDRPINRSVAEARELEPDLALLEAYLDRQLAPPEAQHVEARLAEEPELAGAMARLSAEYALRRTVFQGYEPDDLQASHLASTAVAAARRAVWRGRWNRAARVGGAVAACAAVSFFAGWLGRGYYTAAQARVTPTETPAAHTDREILPEVHHPTPSIREVRTDGADPAHSRMYQVALTDLEGNITAIQQFERFDEAQAFAADVGRWQVRQEQIRRGHPMVLSSGL